MERPVQKCKRTQKAYSLSRLWCHPSVSSLRSRHPELVAVNDNSTSRGPTQVNLSRACPAYKASILISFISSCRPRPRLLCNSTLSTYQLPFHHTPCTPLTRPRWLHELAPSGTTSLTKTCCLPSLTLVRSRASTGGSSRTRWWPRATPSLMKLAGMSTLFIPFIPSSLILILSSLCPQFFIHAPYLLHYPYISHVHFHPTNTSLANTFKRSARNLALALPTRLSPLPARFAPTVPPLKSARVLMWRMAPPLTTTRP